MSIFLALQNLAFSQQETHEIILISTNDPHGRIDNFPKMSAYVQALKRSKSDVFVFNAGDLIDGNPVVDQVKEKGSPIIDIMNSVPYDVSCLGNHELELGETQLQQRIDQSSSVYVDANVKVANNSILRPIKPYVVLHTKAGLNIAVFGLTAKSSNPCALNTVDIQNPIEQALSLDTLKRHNSIVIGLTHIGFPVDSLLATKMPSIDVIIGGHSHTEVPNGALVNGVLISQTGCYMKYLGKTVLTIQNNKIVDKTFELLDFSKMDDIDTDLALKIKEYNTKVDFEREIGIADFDFPDKQSLGHLRADAITSELNLEIAFDHPRNIQLNSFPVGKITLGDVYRIDPFNYKIYRYSLNASQIRSLIRTAFVSDGSRNTPLFSSGISYTISKNAKGQVDSIELTKGKKLLSENKLYSVGINSFVACRFMPQNIKYDIISYTTPELLIKFLAKHTKLDYSKEKREFIVW